jgi:hypothetical protein
MSPRYFPVFATLCMTGCWPFIGLPDADDDSEIEGSGASVDPLTGSGGSGGSLPSTLATTTTTTEDGTGGGGGGGGGGAGGTTTTGTDWTDTGDTSGSDYFEPDTVTFQLGFGVQNGDMVSLEDGSGTTFEPSWHVIIANEAWNMDFDDEEHYCVISYELTGTSIVDQLIGSEFWWSFETHTSASYNDCPAMDPARFPDPIEDFRPWYWVDIGPATDDPIFDYFDGDYFGATLTSLLDPSDTSIWFAGAHVADDGILSGDWMYDTIDPRELEDGVPRDAYYVVYPTWIMSFAE